MRIVVQRVQNAKIVVENQIIASIEKGICALVAISAQDQEADIDYMVRKLLGARLFSDDQGRKWAVGVKDLQLDILCISQFTLYARLKGNKPDFRLSMSGDSAKELYDKFVTKLKLAYRDDKIQEGRFGSKMNVHLENDGPVTVVIDSPSNGDNDSDKLNSTID